jgi:hypothetical protein
MNYIKVCYLHSQGYEDIYRDPINQEYYVRQKSYDGNYIYWIRVEYVDHEYRMKQFIQSNTIIQVIDNDGNILFEDIIEYIDYNYKSRSKTPIMADCIKQHANDVAEELELLTFDEWRSEMLKIKEERHMLAYSSYWIHSHQIKDSTQIIGEGKIIGRPVILIAEKYHHDVIDVQWEIIRWINPSNDQQISTCGYRFV